MKKQAVIIVTPNCPGQTSLPGATRDAEAWDTFLRSPEGGAWNGDEIKIISDQDPDHIVLVLEYHRMRELDYALLAFSGHGSCHPSTGQTTETRMPISRNAYLTEWTLRVKARRELVIMDACREFGGELITEVTKLAAFANALAEEVAVRRIRARALYEDALSRSPEGRTLIYSCRPGQTAYDKRSFTRFLIAVPKASRQTARPNEQCLLKKPSTQPKPNRQGSIIPRCRFTTAADGRLTCHFP